jgi:hypothetical protein
VSKVANTWIDLFRAGDYSDVGKGEYTKASLDEVVKNYDPKHYEAPSTIGHVKPNDKAPAYGWWSQLRRVGDLLQGQMGVVQPEFEEALERQLYKKRSVGLVTRANGLNLHHVAWLGAQAPQIKALADLQFEDENSTELVAIDFAEETEMAELNEDVKKSIKDTVRDAIASMLPGHKPAAGEKTFTEADVTAAATKAAKEAVEAAVKPLTEELATQKKNFSERETLIVTAEMGSRAKAAVDRVKAAKAWVPAFDKAGATQIFEELAKSTEQTVTFGEGADATKKTPLDAFADLMVSFGEIIPAARLAGDVSAKKPAREVPAHADATSVQFDEAIRARMTEKKIGYGAAMDEIATEQPELTRAGSATAGQV